MAYDPVRISGRSGLSGDEVARQHGYSLKAVHLLNLYVRRALRITAGERDQVVLAIKPRSSYEFAPASGYSHQRVVWGGRRRYRPVVTRQQLVAIFANGLSCYFVVISV